MVTIGVWCRIVTRKLFTDRQTIHTNADYYSIPCADYRHKRVYNLMDPLLLAYLHSYLSSVSNDITLLHEFCFPSIFEKYPKTGFYRTPTHRHGVHMKYFPGFLLILNRNFGQKILFLVMVAFLFKFLNINYLKLG